MEVTKWLKPSDSRPQNLVAARVPLNIGRGSNTEMPPELLGAYVDVFVASVDYQSAAHIAVKAITQRGYEFINVFGQILQIEPEKWDSYVVQRWPLLVDEFPSQEQMLNGLSSGFIFFGLFAGYDSHGPVQA